MSQRMWKNLCWLSIGPVVMPALMILMKAEPRAGLSPYFFHIWFLIAMPIVICILIGRFWSLKAELQRRDRRGP